MYRFTTHKSKRVVAVVFALFALAGCADALDNSASDQNSNSESSARTGQLTNATVPDDFEFDSSYNLRFTEIKFDEGTPASNLNSLLGGLLDPSVRKPLVLLMKIRGLAQNKPVKTHVQPGSKADKDCIPSENSTCTYKWRKAHANSVFTTEFDAENGRIRANIDKMTFEIKPGKNGQKDPATLPVRNIQFEGQLLPTSSSQGAEQVVVLQNGELTAIIRKKDADDVMVPFPSGEPFALTNVLRTSQLNHDSDGDGTDDAWKISANFRAKTANIQ